MRQSCHHCHLHYLPTTSTSLRYRFTRRNLIIVSTQKSASVGGRRIGKALQHEAKGEVHQVEHGSVRHRASKMHPRFERALDEWCSAETPVVHGDTTGYHC